MSLLVFALYLNHRRHWTTYQCPLDAVILNSMDTDNSSTHTPAKNPEISAKMVFPLILLAVVIGVFVFIASLIQNTVGFKNAFTFASNFLQPNVTDVASSEGRANILVMGKAGGSHAGADLTDTMIVVSISLEKPHVVLVSIPRDLWIPDLRAKVNSAFYWGNQKTSDGGIDLAKSTVEKVVGVPINYGVVIDGFSAFKDLVDAIGGVEVNVDRSFTDKLYPIAGKENDLCGGDVSFACRYETVSFNAGPQMMDGDTALKFVRSRHAEGDEGTDQAREARQQKVIEAIKTKLMDPKVYLNLKTDLAVFTIARSSIQSDMNIAASAVLARKVWDAGGSINQFIIPENLLINPPISRTYDQQYVLIPKAGNGVWSEVRNWVSGVLE